MRINKFISSNSAYSRRKADELIQQGKVFVNDKKITTLGLDINPQKDKVKINNKLITEQKDKNIYLALNKPAGFITTRNDELNRKTVMDLIPKIKNIKPVGRLDKNTEGLLLFSNDGDFINRYTHPKFECEKEYFAIIQGPLTESEKNKLEKGGIPIDNKKTHPAKIQIITKNSKQTELRITIHEGRNRQIRKMFDYLNHSVKYLKRIRIHKIKLGTLKKGSYRNLTNNEINAQ